MRNNIEYPDVRVIAATNRNLTRMVRDGRFRADLLYRLSVLSVHLPPLRERLADLPILCRTLLHKLHPAARLTPEALGTLSEHHWAGNIRELRNVLTRAFVQGDSRIDRHHISFFSDRHKKLEASLSDEDYEAQFLRQMLRECHGNRSAMARALNMARSTLIYKLRRLGLEK